MPLKTLIILLFFTFCTKLQGFGQDGISIPLGQEMIGVASFYDLPGQQTASGEIMQKGSFTCAHRWYPFGTMLEITNIANNKYVVVKVTDRGPFSGGRMLDMSLEAAKTIGMVNAGTCKIKTVVIGEKGQIYITRSDNTIIENSIKDAVSDSKEPLPLMTNADDKKKEEQQRKSVEAKREKRRKEN